jgi:hypothetical protein
MVQFVRYTERESAAARAFNHRMLAGNAPSDFLLPESPPSDSAGDDRAIRAVYYLAMEDDFVRGGLVLGDYPASLGGASITATICMAPLSEGIVDPKYSMLGMQFVRFLQKQTQYGFATGMGDPSNPYPRLLRASGWTILKVPFFFRVCRPRRFLRELPALNSTAGRRAVARVAEWTGMGAAGVAALQAREWLFAAHRGLSIGTVDEWGPWVDEIWEVCAASCAFSIARDLRTLRDLYPPSESRLLRYSISRNGAPVGWAAAYDTTMQDSKFFGNLRVATILDCVARPADLAMSVAAISHALKGRGVDLIITNQGHALWQDAFRRCGFREGPSNYCFGMSKSVAGPVRAGLGEQAIYLTRGDGDGRMHL